MAERVYLDTSALMRWACATSGSADARDNRGENTLDTLLSGPNELCGSPITVAEYTSVLYDHVRGEEPWAAYFDADDADRCVKRFMEWLADGTIVIRPLGRRAFEMGMAYVASVAANGQRMRGWDAIHLYEACRWAREAGEQVAIATSDDDFQKAVNLFPEFGQFVRILDTTRTLAG
jgi:predicted nucleic acid-binding protein